MTRYLLGSLLFLSSLYGMAVETDGDRCSNPEYQDEKKAERVIASVGLRDTRYVYRVYYPVEDLGIKLEQSLYSVAIGF